MLDKKIGEVNTVNNSRYKNIKFFNRRFEK